jgi:hypothetical protein
VYDDDHVLAFAFHPPMKREHAVLGEPLEVRRQTIFWIRRKDMTKIRWTGFLWLLSGNLKSKIQNTRPIQAAH